MPRYIVEGTWTGYRAEQQRVVHRTVHKEKKFREWCEKTHAIIYTDGTSLILSVRDCKPRERVEVKDGYGKLIRDCFYAGVTSVAGLSLTSRLREPTM